MSNFEHCNRIERERGPGSSLLDGFKSYVKTYWRHSRAKTWEGESLNPYPAWQMTTKWKLHTPNEHGLRPTLDKFSIVSKAIKEGS